MGQSRTGKYPPSEIRRSSLPTAEYSAVSGVVLLAISLGVDGSIGLIARTLASIYLLLGSTKLARQRATPIPAATFSTITLAIGIIGYLTYDQVLDPTQHDGIVSLLPHLMPKQRQNLAWLHFSWAATAFVFAQIIQPNGRGHDPISTVKSRLKPIHAAGALLTIVAITTAGYGFDRLIKREFYIDVVTNENLVKLGALTLLPSMGLLGFTSAQAKIKREPYLGPLMLAGSVALAFSFARASRGLGVGILLLFLPILVVSSKRIVKSLVLGLVTTFGYTLPLQLRVLPSHGLVAYTHEIYRDPKILSAGFSLESLSTLTLGFPTTNAVVHRLQQPWQATVISLDPRPGSIAYAEIESSLALFKFNGNNTGFPMNGWGILLAVSPFLSILAAALVGVVLGMVGRCYRHSLASTGLLSAASVVLGYYMSQYQLRASVRILELVILVAAVRLFRTHPNLMRRRKRSYSHGM